MAAACVPSLLCWLVLTLPGWVFNTPGNNPYYYFSEILESDRASFLPLALTALSTVLALLLPLRPEPANLLRVLRRKIH